MIGLILIAVGVGGLVLGGVLHWFWDVGSRKEMHPEVIRRRINRTADHLAQMVAKSTKGLTEKGQKKKAKQLKTVMRQVLNSNILGADQ